MDDAEKSVELTADAGVATFRVLVDGGGLGRWSSDGEARLREIDDELDCVVPDVRFREGDLSPTESAGEKSVRVDEVVLATLGWFCCSLW